MSIQLPISGTQLIDAAQSELERESEEVKDGLIGKVLPQAINAIFEHDQGLKEILRTHRDLKSQDLVGDIAQTLWSYPGSLGAARVQDIFMRLGFITADAAKLAESVVNLTKYPMSIVNYSRHIGSSIRSIRRAADGPKASNLRISELGLSEEFINAWNESSKTLRETSIRDDEGFNFWLESIEDHLMKYLPVQINANRARAGLPIGASTPPPGGFSMPRAYVRRFGNYIQANSSLTLRNTRTELLGATVTNEYEKILSQFNQSSKSIYELLLEDFNRRSRRLSASASRHLENSRSAPQRSRAGIEQSLNINGKRVEIRSSSAHLSNSLIEGFIKSFNLQHNLSPDEAVLSTRFMIDGEFIEVEAERPAKVDLKKIQTFIESMYRR